MKNFSQERYEGIKLTLHRWAHKALTGDELKSPTCSAPLFYSVHLQFPPKGQVQIPDWTTDMGRQSL